MLRIKDPLLCGDLMEYLKRAGKLQGDITFRAVKTANDEYIICKCFLMKNPDGSFTMVEAGWV